MNSFEVVRQAAGELRRELHASETVGDRPLDVALGIARLLRLEVIWLEAGDPALNGASAVWEPQAPIVKCSKAGTPGEQALRLAHELAHEQMHRLLPGAVPAGSRTASPELDDYGPRERREQEAEVFARELLAPSGEVRRLYLSPGTTAGDVAASLGLPRGVVERQLLDALLLPSANSGRRAPRRLSEPDPSQDAAARHRGGPLLLQAGPGTGKTSTLVSRVVHLVEDHVDPASILVLTFSRRAASEVAERICTALPEAGSRVWVGTFHQFGMDVISRHHDQFDLSPDPSLLDTPAAVELLEDILPTLGLVHYRQLWEPALDLKEILGAISRAKDELVGPERYAELVGRMRSDALASGDAEELEAAARAEEIAKVYACYQARMRAVGALDFGDQVMLAALLCERRPDIATGLRSRHSHVLVDEYQDVNRASISLLKALAGTGDDVWVVGDARQAIYRFRGASSSSMVRFGEDFGRFASARLDVNYRSSQEVVDTFLAFGSGMKAAQGMPTMLLSAARGSTGFRPEFASFDTDERETDAVIGNVRELATAGIAHRDQAVLCLTNAKVDAIAAALEDAGIPVLHLGNIFERSEIRDLLSLLTLAADTTGSGLPRIAAFKRYDMRLSDVRAVTATLQPESGKVVAEAISAMEAPAALSEAGRRGFERLRSDLLGLNLWSSPWEFLTSYLLDRTDRLRTLAADESVAGRMRCLAVWRFMEFVREQPPGSSGPPSRRLLDRIRRIVMLSEFRTHADLPEAASRLEAVKVMTLHGSKGLEFEAVHLLGLTEGQLPRKAELDRHPPIPGLTARATEDIETGLEDEIRAEEECLFFVAVSRARTHLRLYASRWGKAVKGEPRSVSSFLKRVTPLLDHRDLDPPTRLAVRIMIPHDVYWPGGVPVVDGHHLALYAKCPRRLFHTLVLGIRSARKTGPFARTHDCVQKVIDTVGTGRGDLERPPLSDLQAAFEAVWSEDGPHDHAYADYYRSLGLSLVTALHGSLRDDTSFQPVSLEVELSNGRVRVRADARTREHDGTLVLRRVRTGSDPGEKAAENDLLHVLLHVVASSEASDYRVETDYLTGGRNRVIPLTPRKVRNRREKVEELLSALARGEFPIKPDARNCPRCPHWFACGSLAEGEIVMTAPSRGR